MWLRTLYPSARNWSRLVSVITMFFTRATSRFQKSMERMKPAEVFPKPYPGPTAGDAGLTKHEGLYHWPTVWLSGINWQPGRMLGRLYPVIEPPEFERLAGSLLFGANPAMVTGTQPVAVGDAQMLL